MVSIGDLAVKTPRIEASGEALREISQGVKGESASRSDYHVRSSAGADSLRFEVEADGGYPQVGLASMLAKYLREVHMGLFNAHFARVCPDVAPAAGYRGDGRRWLDQSRRAREAAGIPDSDLVRLR